MTGKLLFLCMIAAIPVLPAKAQSRGWKQLFNGRNLDGWEHIGPGGFKVTGGLLESYGGMGLLWYTKQKFGNVKIRVVYKMRDHNDNSGVFIRIPLKPTEPWMPVNKGYEVQIDNHPETSGESRPYHATGTLYSLTRAQAYPGKGSGAWNTMEITLDGPRTIVDVNGVEVTDYTEGQPAPPKEFKFEPDRGRRPNAGYIGLQNHSSKDVVFFKEVAVHSLK